MPFVHDLAGINSDFTPEAIASIDEIIDRLKDKPGSLIPVLTGCQGILGYLPVELQEYIGRRMNIPASDIFGVVTFYSFFTMIPKGRHTIKVCMGTACYVRGMGEILNRIRNGTASTGTTYWRKTFIGTPKISRRRNLPITFVSAASPRITNKSSNSRYRNVTRCWRFRWT